MIYYNMYIYIYLSRRVRYTLFDTNPEVIKHVIQAKRPSFGPPHRTSSVVSINDCVSCEFVG